MPTHIRLDEGRLARAYSSFSRPRAHAMAGLRDHCRHGQVESTSRAERSTACGLKARGGAYFALDFFFGVGEVVLFRAPAFLGVVRV